MRQWRSRSYLFRRVFTWHAVAPAGASSSPAVLAITEFWFPPQIQLRRDSQKARVSFYLAAGKNSSCALLCPTETPLPAPADTTTDVPKVFVFTAITYPPVSESSAVKSTEYRADVLNTYQAAPAACLSSPYSVEKMRTKVRDGRPVGDFRSFWVAEKNPSSDRLSVHPPVFDGKVVVPFHLVNGFRCCATSKTFYDSGIDWASFAKNARLRLWFKKRQPCHKHVHDLHPAGAQRSVVRRKAHLLF